MQIGVLALQGAFIEHEQMLSQLGVSSFEIRQEKDLNNSLDGLIIPGGESTVQGKLLHELQLFDRIKALIENGLPVFGTCAGLLLLAKNIENGEKTHGRQLGSFYTEEDFAGIGKVPMTFIRAPYIAAVQEDTEILARTGGHIVAARQKNQLVTAFHPELLQDTSIHQYFIGMVKAARA